MKRLQSINRNIVECKDTVTVKVTDGEQSINRNIVECKAENTEPETLMECRINRNIVECKGDIQVVYNISVQY